MASIRNFCRQKKKKKNGDRSTGSMQLSATTGSQPRFILYSQVCEACFDAVFRSYRLLLKEQKKKKKLELYFASSNQAMLLVFFMFSYVFSFPPPLISYVMSQLSSCPLTKESALILQCRLFTRVLM